MNQKINHARAAKRFASWIPASVIFAPCAVKRKWNKNCVKTRSCAMLTETRVCLWLRCVAPVELRKHRIRCHNRNALHRSLHVASFDQQDIPLRIFREPISQYAAAWNQSRFQFSFSRAPSKWQLLRKHTKTYKVSHLDHFQRWWNHIARNIAVL